MGRLSKEDKTMKDEREIERIKEEVEQIKAELHYKEQQQLLRQGKCPECGGPLVYESGCMTCYRCGWSACS